MMYLTKVLHLIERWRKYNHSVLELSNLDDRELADIGIARSEIRALARKAAHR